MGRNAILALNIAPDTTGRIPDPDVKRLKEFGDALRSLFTTNLFTAPGTTATAFETLADGGQRQEIQLPNPTKLRYVVLDEDITNGQRVERFEVVIRDVLGRDHPFHATTVGWKRIVKVDVEQAVSVQVRIIESRAEPYVTTSLF